jgi:hypothetical protein
MTTRDTSTHRLITTTRFRLSQEVVYQALEEYGEQLAGSGRFGYVNSDEALERDVAKRGDRLIDLALAKNAGTHEVVADLYKRSRDGTGDPDYDKAVRLACLANRVAVGAPFLDGEFRRLAFEGDEDEVDMLMRNPRRKSVLNAVYGRSGPLADLPPERWLLLVRASIGHPGLNEDESDGEGPDLLAWEIKDALFMLLRTAPVEPRWLEALHELLLGLDPANTKRLNNAEAVLEVIDRWKGLKVPKMFQKEGDERDENGDHTSLPLVDEFRCLVSTLYGRLFVDGKPACIGTDGDPDVVRRCAHYGCAEMNVEDMRVAAKRDADVFVLAAVFNDSIMLKMESRAELELMLPRGIQHLYTRRCQQLQSRHRWFDPRPATDTLAAWEAAEAHKPAESSAVQALSNEVASLKKSIASVTQALFWGFLILCGLVLTRH